MIAKKRFPTPRAVQQALDDRQPIVLDGMQVFFHEVVPLTPVPLAPKPIRTTKKDPRK